MGRRRRRNNRTSCFDEQFDVEEVVDKKTENGKIMYFVKWRGYPPYDNSWVAQEDCVSFKLFLFLLKYRTQFYKNKNFLVFLEFFIFFIFFSSI